MTIKDIATLIEAPESTVRLYRDEFEDFIPAMGFGRRRRYDETTVQTIRKIIEWKKAGTASANIRQELARSATPQEKRRAAVQEDRTATIQITLETQASEIALLRAELAALRNEIGKAISLLLSDRQTGETMAELQTCLLGK